MMQIMCDSECLPGPKPATWRFTAQQYNVDVFTDRGSNPVISNPHIAHYVAVIKALKWAYHAGHRDFTIHTPSRLVVNQGMNRWAVKSPSLTPYYVNVRRGLLACHATLEWIPPNIEEATGAIPIDFDEPSRYTQALQDLNAMVPELTQSQRFFVKIGLERIDRFGHHVQFRPDERQVITNLTETYLGSERAQQLKAAANPIT